MKMRLWIWDRSADRLVDRLAGTPGVRPAGRLAPGAGLGGLILGAFLVGVFLTGAALAGDRDGDVSGMARVVDGDTLDIAGTRVRLEGIDAPESAQKCRSAWWPGRWRCGLAAERALKRLVRGQTVRCLRQGVDKYRRLIGVCYVNGKDINAEMVRLGYAWAFTKYSTSYVAEEATARAARRGIWWAKTEPAWEYRATRWAANEQVAPDGCAIKGNITKSGRIYHMPWSPWYDKVRIDEDDGERWFCSEADAEAAGWRAVAGGA